MMPTANKTSAGNPNNQKSLLEAVAFGGKALLRVFKNLIGCLRLLMILFLPLLAEELGFFRIVLVILAFSFFAYRGYLIARGSSDRFVVLASTGITTWLVMQAFINLAVNLGLMPVIGITLPFISYGGSSMLANLLAVGILLQLSKHSDLCACSWQEAGRGDTYTQYRLN